MVGTLVGFVIFMSLLLFAVQTLVHLYATSVVTAAANQAADRVAMVGGSPQVVPSAETAARAALGAWSRHARFDWEEVDGEEVVLRVTAHSPTLLPLPGSLGAIDRTVMVRTERFR